MNKAVFLDRDGVLIEDTNYPGDPEKIVFLPKIADAVRSLNEKGYKVIVATNQSGVARGYFTEKEVKEINKKIEKKLGKEGAKIDKFYYCPHHPDDNCECRKPKPGMLLKAKRDFNIDFKKSYVIGDALKDVETGKKVGCKTILISKEENAGYKTAKNLFEAVKLVE